MNPVLSSIESFTLDIATINRGHISKKKLMDNAGCKSAQFIIENIHNPFNQHFIILVGPGNNGGDALICHYYLLKYGVNSQLLILDDRIKNNWIFKDYSIDADSGINYSDINILSSDNWYIDGLFGIGFKRDITGPYKTLIQMISKFPHIISLDIPSGIYGNTGMSAEKFIKAEFTLAMGFPKWGHYFNAGIESTGNLNILNIGIDASKISNNHVELIEQKDIYEIAPINRENIHKYNRGKIISIAGSLGYSGACILAVDAAITSGAGIVKALVPMSMMNTYESTLTEAILIPLDDNFSSSFSSQYADNIISEISWADVVLFGPGLSTDSKDIEWMSEVIKSLNKPLILDASGFQPIIESKLKIDDLPQETILTPHCAEFSRIFNLNLQKILNDPILAVKSIIPYLGGRVLILKGPTNIIVTSESKILLMNHGTSDLATAGSGDVLAGILASTIAQGLNIDDAAIYSTYLHAECVHQYYKSISEYGLTATDLISMLPYAIEKLHYVS